MVEQTGRESCVTSREKTARFASQSILSTGSGFGQLYPRAGFTSGRLLCKSVTSPANIAMTEMNRVEMLEQFLAANPNDPFARYGLAMEYSRSGDIETALAEFRKLLELHPDYTAGYQMAGQMLLAAGRTEEGRKMLQDGIACAQRTGNLHAQQEMEGILQEIS